MLSLPLAQALVEVLEVAVFEGRLLQGVEPAVALKEVAQTGVEFLAAGSIREGGVGDFLLALLAHPVENLYLYQGSITIRLL